MFSHTFKRLASGGAGGYHGAQQIALARRPQRKIRLGKARPAVYHQFEVKVELSDGSVIYRKSQYPKDEIRLIQDQRNNPLWNASRDDLVVVDANAGGKLDRFKQKYSQFDVQETDPKKLAAEAKKGKKVEEKTEDSMNVDDYLHLLGQNLQNVQSGGKLATKKKTGKK